MFNSAIFDLDGTLICSTKMWKTLGERYVSSLGKTPKAGLCETLWEMSVDEAARFLKNEYEIEKEAREIVFEIHKMTEKFYREEAELKRGAAELLERLRKENFKIAAATAGNVELEAAALKRLRVLGYFTKILGCDEYGKKNSPEIFLAAAKILNSEPKNTLVFEDDLIAAKTAKSAGFAVCGVRDESETEQEELKAIADFYVDRLDEAGISSGFLI